LRAVQVSPSLNRHAVPLRVAAIPAVVVPLLALCSCAEYLPNPLSERIDLRDKPALMMVTPADVPLPVLRSHRFDLRRPLDMDEVATLAVVANPDLRAARARLGVARAQSFAAGILPNPQFTVDYGFLTGGPGTNDGYAIGLAQDVLPLLTLSVRKAAAERDAAAVSLDILWQEWLVVSQARTLYVQRASLEQQRAILTGSLALFAGRYQRSNAAMMKGDEILPVVAADLVSLSAIETQTNDVEQLILRNKHDLNALLGLKPDAPLRLAGLSLPSGLDGRRLTPRLADLAGHRPDILALKLGYGAEEERVRQTIIEQFPKLSIGTSRAKDTTAVFTQTLSVSLTLPVFDRNQGNIAIEAATRERLKLEYQARLNASYAASARLVTEIALAEGQLRTAESRTANLQTALDQSQAAFKAGNLDGRTYADLETSLVTSKLTAAKLRQVILEQRVALQTLVGSELPNSAVSAARIL